MDKIYETDGAGREQESPAVQRYVDILTNSGFKALFGDPANKDVIISIINALLPGHRQVRDIRYAPTEHQGPTLTSKEFRYDFMCRGDDGSCFIVEVQNYRDDHWFKRCVSYAARAYDGQNRCGEDYDVAPVYLIGIVGVPVFHRDEEQWRGRYISEYTFREKVTGDLQEDTIFLIFAELARFGRSAGECRDPVDRMCYVFKNIGHLQNQPAELRDSITTRIFQACDISRFTDDKRNTYEQDMYDEKRYRGELATEKRISREEGLQEGREKAQTEMAGKMLAAGLPLEQIVRFTGLDVGAVEALAASAG